MICPKFAIGAGLNLGDVYALVGVFGLARGTACAEVRQALVRIRDQIDSARDFPLRPAPQLQIALVETRESRV